MYVFTPSSSSWRLIDWFIQLNQSGQAEHTTAADANSGASLPLPVVNLGTLLTGFLRFYGKEFDYMANYVCAKRSGVAPRRCVREDGSDTVWGEQPEKESVGTEEKKIKPVQEKLGVACLIDAGECYSFRLLLYKVIEVNWISHRQRCCARLFAPF